MYKRKPICVFANERATFWKNNSKHKNNFIVGLLINGRPVLPDYHEIGIELNECRTIPSLKNYIKRWEMERLIFLNEQLQKAIETGAKSEISSWAEIISWNPVVWSFEEDNFRESESLNYKYVLKDGTVYISDPWASSECPMDEYFIMDLVENMENFVIAACETKCLIKTPCTRSYKQKTLCPDAYNEIKEYVNKQLNA